MSPRLRAALYAQAGAVFSLHPCLYAGDRPTAGRSRFATLLPGDAAVSPSNGDHAGTQRADPPPPRNGPKHRGAGRSRSATGPPRQSRSTRQFFCAEVLVALVEDPKSSVPESARGILQVLIRTLNALEEQLKELDGEIARRAKADPVARRLMTIPGIGPIAATAITALVPAPEGFRAGRDFAAWLGLTPLQKSTGGKHKLGAISKMGERTLRRLLILGASAVVRWASRRGAAAGSWLGRRGAGQAGV